MDRAAARPLLLIEGGAHEADEERVTAARIRRELGVELAAEEPRVAGQLDHLDEIARCRAFGARADREARRFQARQVMIVDFVAMTMPFGDGRRAVDLVRQRSGDDFAWLRAETHRAAQVRTLGTLFDRAVAVLPF